MHNWNEVLFMAALILKPPSQVTTCLEVQLLWALADPLHVITLHDLVVEVTCLKSRPSLSSWMVWSACCFTFFLSRLDLHWISVNKPGKIKHRDFTPESEWACGREAAEVWLAPIYTIWHRANSSPSEFWGSALNKKFIPLWVSVSPFIK